MYADKITRSMKLTIEETNRRREKQIAYNTEHGLVPTPLNKKKDNELVKSLNPYFCKRKYEYDFRKRNGLLQSKRFRKNY